MSLLGALQVGKSSLVAQQAAIQVTGNNIANAGTAGYTRETVNMAPAGTEQIGMGNAIGTGVNIASVDQQVNAALEESLRGATSDQSGAQALNTSVSQLESTFGALNDNDLSARLTTFFNSFSTLANNPQDAGQRSVVIQNGVSLSSYITDLRSKISTQRQTTETQIQTLSGQANNLVQTIADYNGQIQSAEAGGGTASALRDQRNTALSQLSQLMDIRVVPQSNGQINVLTGSTPLIQGTTARTLTSKQTTDPTGKFVSTALVFGDTGDPVSVNSGQIGALMNARDNYITPALTTLDTVANSLIGTVNSIHSQGQGLTGFSSVTGTTQVTNPAVALNTAGNGVAYLPANGTFNLNLKDASGNITTQQIQVNLSGNGTQTTLASLAASINAAAGGQVTATVSPAGQLTLASTSTNTSFTVSNDTSGVLASLGINTFFTGKDASTIAVNQTVVGAPDLLATGRDNIAGSNRNAQAIALAGGAASTTLGGQSLQDFYTQYIGNLASQSKTASDNSTSQQAIYTTISAQREAISGVDMNEESVNLMKYQQGFQGSARYINVVNQMMQTLLTMIA